MRRVHKGFVLYSIEHDEKFFRCAAEAIDLLERVDARRAARAKRYLPIIAHVRQGSDFYKPSAHAFYVHDVPDDSAYFASAIVHEATHGYLFARKIPYAPELRERIERLCSKEQFAFIVRAIRVQAHVAKEKQDEVIQQWTDWFSEQLASGWWHQQKMKAGQVRALCDMLKELWASFGWGQRHSK